MLSGRFSLSGLQYKKRKADSMIVRFLVVFLLLAGVGFCQTFVGTLDGYFGYNLNKAQSQRNLYRNFDFKHNQFSLNYAEIAVEQKPTAALPVGFRADVGFGDAATWVHATEPAGADVFRYLQQAYVSASHKKVQVDFGKFVTWSGAEVIETKDNWNYSRSILFSWAIPYYHFGVRTTWTATDKVALAGFVVNGWNIYGRASPTSKLRIAPRFEWYDDPQGFTLGRAQTLKEGTLTTDIVMNENMFLRGEYRYDWSDRAVFERNNDRRLLSHQSTLTVGVVFTYTKTR